MRPKEHYRSRLLAAAVISACEMGVDVAEWRHAQTVFCIRSSASSNASFDFFYDNQRVQLTLTGKVLDTGLRSPCWPAMVT